MCFLYILHSEVADRYYVGITNNLEKRLQQHNSKKTKSTKSYTPWILVYKEVYQTKSEAMKRESIIKRKKRRSYIESLISSSSLC